MEPGGENRDTANDVPVLPMLHLNGNKIANPTLLARWLIYRRTNHAYFHVHSYKEADTFTTPFDMAVLSDLAHFHLVMDTIDHLPQTGVKGIYLKQQLKDKLIEHRQYINKLDQDMPGLRNWKWNTPI